MKTTHKKILAGERITADECLALYRTAALPELGAMANILRERLNGKYVYFNRNVHIEPTNVCANRCLFCSYRRDEGQPESWDLSLDEIFAVAQQYAGTDITEVHIVGGVHPRHTLDFYEEMVSGVRRILPNVHIKAFTAEELWQMAQRAQLPVADALARLKSCGLQSIPGGGAEILDDGVRAQICPTKVSAQGWLEVHRRAHEQGVASNATMLYGHVETYEHRVRHLQQLRDLQDKTGGFNAFIPLKFFKKNNSLSGAGEVSAVEELRNMAVCRIFLDNIPHLKAYWPMCGKAVAQLALSFGADDMDGTIDDSTKIYSMAGADDKSPKMTVDELCEMARQSRFIPVERDSLYRPIKQY
ncbi:MAG: aminofutalosine synthase MqnE [Prevotellaceae bacterium]|nr:aminofutalosine synthase MqnE [Prevotellaceae bacterium]